MTPKLSNVSSIFRTYLSRIATLWRESHRKAAKDFRTRCTRWPRCGLWLLLAAWFAVLLTCFIRLLRTEVGSFGLCLPDGSFAIDSSHFRYLSSSGFFQITLATGNMTFTQVKAIDIIWDIFVGRGGQALIAYTVTPVTFGTYRTVFLPNGGLFLAILFTIRDFVTRHGLHSKLAMVFMVYTMMFTFLYPTLASAMTGYSANVEAVINTTAGEYVPYGSFGLVYFVVHDGWRIPDLHGNLLVIEPFRSYGFPYCYTTFVPESDLDACVMQREVTRYYMQQNGRCQAVLDYNWGFSYVQLFVMLILQMIWTTGLYIMWLRAYVVMKRRGRGKEDVTGEHKAVFELANAMREQMDEPTKEEADDVFAFTEAKLRQRITKDLRGGSISYTAPLLPNGEIGQEWDTKAWIRSYKLSIAAMVVCVVAMILSATHLPPTTMFLLPLPAELAMSLYIGSNRKSRIVLFVWIFIVITVPTQTAVFLSRF